MSEGKSREINIFPVRTFGGGGGGSFGDFRSVPLRGVGFTGATGRYPYAKHQEALGGADQAPGGADQEANNYVRHES